MNIPPELVPSFESLPQSPGVYLFRDKEGKVLYVGKSVRLKDRVKSYFVLGGSHLGPKTNKLIQTTHNIDHIVTDSEIEALLLESDLIKRHKPPFNTQWKDDKSYKYIQVCFGALRKQRGLHYVVDKKYWPWITTSRKKDDRNSLYFGPFPAGRTVNSVLITLRRIFPWCKYQTFEQYRREEKACFYSHIGLCPGICNGSITLDEYWKIFDHLVLFLHGKKKTVQESFRKNMIDEAENEHFERAAFYRDQLEKINYITQQFHDPHEYLNNVNLREDLRAEELNQLLNVIGMNTEKYLSEFVIEGYDISNLGGLFTVASRVSFKGGDADKSQYRRYRIRREKLPNDFAAMKEVLARRLNGKDPYPDLILIDGGKGQLHAALEVIHQLGHTVPAIGLAKKLETIIVPSSDGYKELTLPANSPARKLVMRIRDESHRFAQSYHKHLRSKYMLNKS
ncbi:GIY-YIG nuclease family protein [candidate division WWE3 bacterium]|nr:GIY-YIG nuclease family protein [candidate division WWE3 bacterium]